MQNCLCVKHCYWKTAWSSDRLSWKETLVKKNRWMKLLVLRISEFFPKICDSIIILTSIWLLMRTLLHKTPVSRLLPPSPSGCALKEKKRERPKVSGRNEMKIWMKTERDGWSGLRHSSGFEKQTSNCVHPPSCRRLRWITVFIAIYVKDWQLAKLQI